MLSILWTFLFYAWFASEMVIAVAMRTRHSTGKVRDRGSQLLLWVVMVFSVTACEWLRRLLTPNILSNASWLMPASIVLIFIGLAVRALAIFTLGKSFSANVAIRDSQKIYRGGLYRFLRHPSYLGLILIFLAIGLHSRNWLCLAIAFLPTTAALLFRIHIEEAALRNAFAEDYASYSKVTKRLIPGIY
jgi:protein-S-isoprenylcysteine O-methyltransferase Ste14